MTDYMQRLINNRRRMVHSDGARGLQYKYLLLSSTCVCGLGRKWDWNNCFVLRLSLNHTIYTFFVRIVYFWFSIQYSILTIFLFTQFKNT